MKKIIGVISVIFLSSFFNVQAEDKSGMTLEKFLTMSKAKADKAGNKFNKKGKVAQFKKMDTNKDGKVSNKESKTYWNSKKK